MDFRFTCAALFVFGLASAQNCYGPAGNVSTKDAPCSTDGGVSVCCPYQWACLSNGLCWLDNAKYFGRYTCTDRTWQSSSCPQICTHGNKIAGNEAVLQCSDGSYCCDGDRSFNCCTTSGTQYFNLQQGSSIATILSTSTPSPVPSLATPNSAYAGALPLSSSDQSSTTKSSTPSPKSTTTTTTTPTTTSHSTSPVTSTTAIVSTTVSSTTTSQASNTHTTSQTTSTPAASSTAIVFTPVPSTTPTSSSTHTTSQTTATSASDTVPPSSENSQSTSLITSTLVTQTTSSDTAGVVHVSTLTQVTTISAAALPTETVPPNPTPGHANLAAIIAPSVVVPIVVLALAILLYRRHRNRQPAGSSISNNPSPGNHVPEADSYPIRPMSELSGSKSTRVKRPMRSELAGSNHSSDHSPAPPVSPLSPRSLLGQVNEEPAELSGSYVPYRPPRNLNRMAVEDEREGQ